MRRVGWRNPGAMWRTAPFISFWRTLDRYFDDQRLRQLFARYATYVGSSPLRAPATLMLIAHVEQEGVWLVDGGMRALALAIRRLAEQHGAQFQFETPVAEILVAGGSVSGVRLQDGERLSADAVVFNGDTSALGAGLLGAQVRHAAPGAAPGKRGLSALTWCLRATPRGFPLHYHNVFFSERYPDEFSAIFGRRDIVARPTVYLCAQDRLDGAVAPTPERMLMLVNAPPDGDRRSWLPDQIQAMRERALDVLRLCGLRLEFSEHDCVATTPSDFADLFPGSGGSLYGRASHGMFSSFSRPGARSAIPGLYLAGGSVHPGPGVPMAALSGRLAASALMTDG
jgi:1-hydroxycarotenoid 3,4-desaturase